MVGVQNIGRSFLPSLEQDLVISPFHSMLGNTHENTTVQDDSSPYNNAGYGVRSDGKILFINASTCDINYLPCNPPVVFDVTIPS